MTLDGYPEITDADVLTCVRSKFQTDDVQVDSWEVVSMMEEAKLGFLGDHYRLLAQVQHPVGAAPRQVSFFLKAAPRNIVQLELVRKTGALRKEVLFYRHLAKEFATLVPMEPVPECQPFVFPSCHLVKDDCFVIDDLTPFNLKSVPYGPDGLDYDHIRLVIPAIARFHAASLVMEEKHGKRLDEMFPDMIYETLFDDAPDHACALWHATSIKLCVDAVPLFKYGKDPALVKRIQEALPALIGELFPSMKRWEGVRNVMGHGDLWVNNLMYRYKDGKPVEVMLVDMQLLRYTSPANDLMMLLGFCTPMDFQARYLPELSKLYWDTLAAVLREAGCDVEKLLPWAVWERTLHDMKKFGLLLMAIEIPIAACPSPIMDDVLSDPEKWRKHFLRDRSVMLKVYYEDDGFRNRWTELMEALIDEHILKQ